MIKALKSSIIISGQEFILIETDCDIDIESLCSIFGNNTVRVINNGLVEIHAMFGNDNYFPAYMDFSKLKWTEIEIG